MVKCLTCNTEILNEWRKDKKHIKNVPLLYCSRSCSNKRKHTAMTKHKISLKIKNIYNNEPDSNINFFKPNKNYGHKKKTSKIIICSFCKNEFIAFRKNTKSKNWPTLCSDNCYIETKRKNAQGNKSLIYNNKRFDSNWEIEMVKFFEEQNIHYIFPSPIYWIDDNMKQHKYFPDFFIPKINLYIDPKNPIVIYRQKRKLEILSNMINLIYGHPSDLKNQILKRINNGESNRT